MTLLQVTSTQAVTKDAVGDLPRYYPNTLAASDALRGDVQFAAMLPGTLGNSIAM